MTQTHEPQRQTTQTIKPAAGKRFLRLCDVAKILNISGSQTYALVRSGDLPAIKVGGRGQWRVEAVELEKYIDRMYGDTRRFISRHPFGADDDEPPLMD